MAITRLTDIITVFDSKWTYGDVKFGYDGEVNQDHDTQYPLMLVTPPESIMPDIYDGREEYSFEINFYNLYSQAAQSVVTLQKRWDNLQDLSNEWLDMVLKRYQDGNVEAYLNDESIEIERIKDTKNDKLVQIKLIFTISAFTRCFRPISSYPSDFADLSVWLRADSGVTFDIPTKKVSLWADKSGKNNNMNQVEKSQQPLRYGYGGQDDKSYFSFDGVNDSMHSSNNFTTGTASTLEFTIFEVSKISSVSNSVFGYYHLTDGSSIEMGTNASGKYEVSVSDGTTSLSTETVLVAADEFHIAVLRKSNRSVYFDYYDSSVSHSLTNYNASYIIDTSFTSEPFNIGGSKESDGLIPPASVGVRYLNGGVQEVITYDRKLSDTEIAKVVGYLNLKYKIY
tara:strand:+ start:701 stop:1891 length:1191 start_codon:yes stop_codon:yes gene_type:complete